MFLAHNVIVIFLVLILLGILPIWPYTYGWPGPYRYGSPIGLLVLILVILLLL